MKIVVTGHKGFIGSVMCKLLTEQGHEVHGIDWRLPDPSPYVHREYINTFDSICTYVNIREFDAIFHFAAYADVPDSVAYPAKYYRNNTGNTASLLDELRYHGYKGRFIFSSTAAVYAESDTPVLETSLIQPPNPYGRSKYACEQLLDDWNKAHGYGVVKFRYFNVGGAYDDVGDHHDATHVIQRLCDAHYHQKAFTIFGNDKRTFDGTCVRDYVHVIDICRAHLHALQYLIENPGCYTFNLGSGQGFSVKQVVEAFSRFTGKTTNIITSAQGRPGDPDLLVADNSKFIAQTGFEYKHTNLEQIINSAWMHFNNTME